MGMQGKELKAIRQRMKLTQEQFAELVGVTANTVARWERDEMVMREPAARLIQGIYATQNKRGKGRR